MTAKQRERLEPLLKDGQVLVNIKHKEIGVDEMGLPIFGIEYVSAPKNYRLVRTVEAYSGAILEDLTSYSDAILKDLDEKATNK